MTTTGKRSSPKKNRNFKMKFSPKKYHSPKKTVKDNKAKDHIAALQKPKKAREHAIKATQMSRFVPLNFHLQRRGLPKSAVNDIASKKAHSISTSGSPETPKRTKNMSGDNSKLSPLDATEDVVPSFDLCAQFGFIGKKAEVARTLIKVQRAFNRLKFNDLSSNSPYNYTYMSTGFKYLYRETAAIGAEAVSKCKLWDNFERGIIQLLEMRLAHYKVSRGTLFGSLGYKIALWNRNIYYAGTCQGSSPNGSLRIVPAYGALRELVDLAITLHLQIEAVKEFDRVDGMTEFAQKAGYY